MERPKEGAEVAPGNLFGNLGGGMFGGANSAAPGTQTSNLLAQT